MFKSHLKDILEKEAPSKQDILKRVHEKKQKQTIAVPQKQAGHAWLKKITPEPPAPVTPPNKTNTTSMVAGAAVIGAAAGILSTLFLVPKVKKMAGAISKKFTEKTITPMQADPSELLEFEEIAADDFGFSADLNDEEIEDFSPHADAVSVPLASVSEETPDLETEKVPE